MPYPESGDTSTAGSRDVSERSGFPPKSRGSGENKRSASLSTGGSSSAQVNWLGAVDVQISSDITSGLTTYCHGSTHGSSELRLVGKRTDIQHSM